ncbi:MAG: hypothetical protein [Microvirus sp.]|nr:MAG: hypothetical protein [Microvirus sp.]
MPRRKTTQLTVAQEITLNYILGKLEDHNPMEPVNLYLVLTSGEMRQMQNLRREIKEKYDEK